jgi:putative permease
MPELGARLLKLLLALIILTVAFLFLLRIGNIVRLVVIAALLAYVLDPIVGSLESQGINRGLSTMIVLVFIMALLSVFAVSLLPQIIDELKSVSSGISGGKAVDIVKQLEVSIEEKFYFLGISDLDLMGKFQEYSRQAAKLVYGYLLDAMAILTNLLLIAFVMFFFLKDGREFIKNFLSLIPNRYFELTLSLIHKTDKQLGSYIRGQFLDSAIIGGLTVIALWALDIKYFLLLGVVLGISNLVPVLGPIVGSIPAIIMALVQTGSLENALYVAAAMFAVQLLDNFMVKPVVVARSVSLHPVIVILAVITGGKLFGIMGMILSVPAIGIVKLIVMEAAANIRKYRYSY